MTPKRLRTSLAIAACAIAAAPALAQSNPLARAPELEKLVSITGRWNGANLERRTACTSPQNEGSRGTYAEFVIGASTAGDFGITQNGVTGLTCSYVGRYRVEGANRSASGTYTCSDGKRGDFTTRGMLVTDTALSIHMDIVLNTTETCTIEAIIGAARLDP